MLRCLLPEDKFRYVRYDIIAAGTSTRGNFFCKKSKLEIHMYLCDNQLKFLINDDNHALTT
jgi:hypothetical protein